MVELAKNDDGNSIITKEVEEIISKYDDAKGTFTYQWVDSEGNTVGTPSESKLTDTNRTLPEIPSYTYTGLKSDDGKTFEYKLSVIFTPENTKKVEAKTKIGTIAVKVKSDGSIVPTNVPAKK